MITNLKTQLKSQKGQGLSEYGLIVSLIAVACIIALAVLGVTTAEKFFDIGDEIKNAKPVTGGGGTGL